MVTLKVDGAIQESIPMAKSLKPEVIPVACVEVVVLIPAVVEVHIPASAFRIIKLAVGAELRTSVARKVNVGL